MTEKEKQYAKGFNDGYQLSKHEPDLLNKLMKSATATNDYIQGLQQGKKQHEREKLLEQMQKSGKTRGLEI